jgi:diguanylate cyclase (GGDEF)-like protein
VRFGWLRVLLGHVVLVALLALLVLFANQGIDGLHARHREVAASLAPFVIDLESAALAAKAAANDERGYLLAGDQKFADEFDSRQPGIDTSLAAARASALHESDRQRVDEIATAVTAWRVAVRRELDLFRTDRAAAVAVALSANRDARKAYEALFQQAIAQAQRDLDLSVHRADQAATSTKRYLLLLFLSFVLVALMAAAMVIRHQKLRHQSALYRHQTQHDTLTGLPNRALFAERLGQALAQPGRTEPAMAVMLIDLDRFKEVNATLGHRHGDLLLQEIGPRLQAVLRAPDTVARLGGDEFAVLLPDTDEAAAATAQRILATLHASFTLADVPVDLEASIGVAIAPTHGQDTEDLLRHADTAMYHAKQTNAGVAIYDPETHLRTPGRLLMLGQLRRALNRPGELVLHYQPKVSLTGGNLCGVEALLRWHHPDRGPVPPAEFIPVAENTGLINALTTHALTLAIRQARAWLDDGHRVPIAVNLSARCLHDTTLPRHIAQLLAAHQVPPELLRLEVTESACITNPTRALAVLNAVHDLGIRLSIDDYGTGYSSMAYLKHLPVDELKIDRSFVTDIDTDNDTALIHSAIDLGHSLGLTIVAEGIETENQAHILTDLGCDIAQGYYYARPMPPDDMTTWLTSQAATLVGLEAAAPVGSQSGHGGGPTRR